MKKISDRVIAHVDIDYFYAQCEEIRNPAIKNKPIVVCQYSNRTKDSGAVATTNYLARKYGVKSGISIIMAQNLLKNYDATLLPADHDYYEKISGHNLPTTRDTINTLVNNFKVSKYE